MVLTKMTHRSISCEKSPRALIDQWEPLITFYQNIPLTSMFRANPWLNKIAPQRRGTLLDVIPQRLIPQPLDKYSIAPLLSNVNARTCSISETSPNPELYSGQMGLSLWDYIAKPLSLFTRNHTEPHDRGIIYHLHCSIRVMRMLMRAI